MFGFIRPVKAELRVREAERFQSVYCGLCHAIRQRYGSLHTLFLSYDMAFLALLLDSLRDGDGGTRRARCVASPARAKPVLCETPAVAYVADLSVLLIAGKLEDSVADERGMKRVAARCIRALASYGFRKARARLPEEDAAFTACLKELSGIESAKTPSIDRPADPFARLLAACAPDTGDDTARCLRELLYHTGRWIYLIDACADLREDWEAGNYNPIALRYGLASPDLSPIRGELETTLSRSMVSVRAAFELLPVQRDREILENIICLGLPVVTRQVLDGTYQSNGGRSRHGSL